MEPTTRTLIWSSAGISHPGHLRPRNEDAWLARPEAGLWLVADGLGGHEDGHLASQAIVDALAYEAGSEPLTHYVEQVRETLFEVNRQLHARALARGADCCIGSTVAVLLSVGDRCACIWAGDSRLYVLRRHQLFQVSRDHNLERQWQEEGQSTQRGFNQAQAQMLTQAIGLGPALQLEVRTFQAMPGDVMLLCTDGVYRELSPEDIAKSMELGRPRDIVQALSEQVLQGPARDNLTAVVIRCDG